MFRELLSMKTTHYKNLFYFSILLSFQLLSLDTFSQPDTLYFNFDKEQIDKVSFNKKINSKYYFGIRYSTDTLVVQDLMPNHLFGQLNPVVKSQLFKVLSSRCNIDTTKTLSIYYVDSLKTVSEFPKRDFIIFRDSVGDVIGTSKYNGFFLDIRLYRKAKYREYKPSFKSFNKISFKISKKHRRFQYVTPVFFYGYNEGLDLNSLKVKWNKDHGHLIKNLFKTKNYFFRTLILKPNGEYFVRYGSNHVAESNELFDEQKWVVLKNAYDKEMKINK